MIELVQSLQVLLFSASLGYFTYSTVNCWHSHLIGSPLHGYRCYFSIIYSPRRAMLSRKNSVLYVSKTKTISAYKIPAICALQCRHHDSSSLPVLQSLLKVETRVIQVTTFPTRPPQNKRKNGPRWQEQLFGILIKE